MNYSEIDSKIAHGVYMSTHEAKVVEIKEILPHPDPETIRLGIVKVWDYQCVVAKDQWKVGDLAVYVEPDNCVDGAREEFKFLNGDKPPKIHRIKAKRLRGTWSEGLLVPAPADLKEGDNAWETLGITRYVPQIVGRNGSRSSNLDSEYGTGGEWEEAPIKLPFSKYDVENFKKYNSTLNEGEKVIISEKIHGANAKFMFSSEMQRMFAGSRTGWKAKSPDFATVETPNGPVTYKPKDNIWWQAIEQNPLIEKICRANPDMVFFGEVFGQVQDLKYGAKQNQIFFRMFDAWSPEKKDWLSFDEILTKMESVGKDPDFTAYSGIPVDSGEILFSIYAPILYVGPYTKEKVLELTDGQSLIPGANHIREGVVVKPTTERFDHRIGRVILKSVSNLYLERA